MEHPVQPQAEMMYPVRLTATEPCACRQCKGIISKGDVMVVCEQVGSAVYHCA